MKRIIVFALLLCSLVVTCFAECNLDTTRWVWLGSNDTSGLFYDNRSLEYGKYNKTVSVWFCIYCTENHDYLKIDSEHYHYYYNSINYSNNMFVLKDSYVRDAKGRVIDSYNNPEPSRYWSKIVPDSVIEQVAIAVRPKNW